MGNNQSLRRSIQQERWHEVRHILSMEDGKARARTKSYTVSDETVTALHLACRHKAPADVIETLIVTGQPMPESSPSSLSPLHYAMMTKPVASPEVVRLLLDAFPNDVAKLSSRASGSKTPLHVACERKAPTTVIRMLHDADPSASDIPDGLGQTALDVARLHTWVFNPIWRRKVKRILKEEHAANQLLLPAPEIPPPPHFPSSPHRRPSSPQLSSPSSPPASPPRRDSDMPIATATLVADNYSSSQLPVAAATLVETPATASLTPSAPPDTMDTALEDKGVCVLCWDNQAEVALVPCGHVCLCTHCCGQSEILNAALQHQCPVCRSRFHQTLRVYHAGISR